MSQTTKLLQRLLNKPEDFTWDELVTLLSSLGYTLISGDGSSRKFYNNRSNAVIFIHEPHPNRVLKRYQVLEILRVLKENGYLK